jgi:hypothetical protein
MAMLSEKSAGSAENKSKLQNIESDKSLFIAEQQRKVN